MKQEFNPIFSLLSRDYKSRTVGRRAAPILDIFRQGQISQMVEAAIIDAEQALPKGIELRPDARHFLLVNLTEMVAAPLMIVNDRFPLGENVKILNELNQDLKHDTSAITKAAAETIREGQISSNNILRTLAGSLEGLRLNRFQVWG